MADLLDLDVEPIFEPLGCQVSTAPGLAHMALGCDYPTEQHRKVAEVRRIRS